jgi:hypothetical protein
MSEDPNEAPLIPSPSKVRTELARSVREARRLRSLLRLSVRAEQDRRYVAALAASPQAANRREGGRDEE